MPRAAKDTADFLSQMDKLFDVFNTSSLGNANPMRRGLQESNEEEVLKFLSQSEKWLSSVKSKSGSTLPCIEGWKQNINSLRALWTDQKSAGATSLLTRRLNQDMLEHLFGTIRGKGGHQDNPDCKGFRFCYRQSVIDFMEVHGSNPNCEPDDVNLLLKLSLLQNKSEQKEKAAAATVRGNDGRYIRKDVSMPPQSAAAPSCEL